MTLGASGTTADIRETVTSIRRASAMVQISNHVSRDDVAYLLPRAEKAIGRLASLDTIMRVAACNPDSIWLYRRTGEVRPEGFQAALLLNTCGRDRLLSETLDLLNPPPELLVSQAEEPALIYIWASYTPGILAAGIPRVIDRYSSPRYRDADVVSRSSTVRGHRSMVRLGFVKGLTYKGVEHPDLYGIMRSPESQAAGRPRYDSYDYELVPTGITVAHGLEDILKVAAIRSAVFLAEQACPFDEEFDGNDFAATHLIAYVENEPAGCMRLRFFGDFAKLERLAVRKEFRTTKTAFRLVRAAVDLCRAKGFRKLYGHARVDLLDFWRSFGFHLKEGTQEFEFSDYRYVEMQECIEPGNDHVSLQDGPYRSIRPEGRWHRPGVLEVSAKRGHAGQG